MRPATTARATDFLLVKCPSSTAPGHGDQYQTFEQTNACPVRTRNTCGTYFAMNTRGAKAGYIPLHFHQQHAENFLCPGGKVRLTPTARRHPATSSTHRRGPSTASPLPRTTRTCSACSLLRRPNSTSWSSDLLRRTDEDHRGRKQAEARRTDRDGALFESSHCDLRPTGGRRCAIGWCGCGEWCDRLSVDAADPNRSRPPPFEGIQ